MTGAAPTEPPGTGRGDRPATWRLVAAIAVPVVAVLVVVGLSAVVRSEPSPDASLPLAIPAVDAPGASTPACAALMSALPATVGGLHRRQLAGPVDGTVGASAAAGSPVTSDTRVADTEVGAVAAWGEPAVILRCGVPTPHELTCSAAVQVVDGVTWLPLVGDGSTTYLVVDRAVRVALTVPDGTNTGPWQETSKIVARTLPRRAICSGGLPIPAAGE